MVFSSSGLEPHTGGCSGVASAGGGSISDLISPAPLLSCALLPAATSPAAQGYSKAFPVPDPSLKVCSHACNEPSGQQEGRQRSVPGWLGPGHAPAACKLPAANSTSQHPHPRDHPTIVCGDQQPGAANPAMRRAVLTTGKPWRRRRGHGAHTSVPGPTASPAQCDPIAEALMQSGLAVLHPNTASTQAGIQTALQTQRHRRPGLAGVLTRRGSSGGGGTAHGESGALPRPIGPAQGAP